MMAKIITKSNTDELASWITKFLANSPAKLIRIEGVCGSGKTTIGQKLAANGVGLHIVVDGFAIKPSEPTPYPHCIKQDELNGTIDCAIHTGRTVILDGVCLEDVAPKKRWGRGLSVYVKRLSFNSTSPTWHVGFNLEDSPPLNEPDRSVQFYHLKYLPHMKADLILEFPEDFHELPKLPFSRERCFDPSGGVIVACEQ